MASDTYPGDAAYTDIVQEIYDGVTSDAIVMADWNDNQGNAPGHALGRRHLAQLLVDKHDGHRNADIQRVTNAAFISTTLAVDQLVAAMTYTGSYGSAHEWNRWAGLHRGHWYGDDASEELVDDARWYEAIRQPSQVEGDVDAAGNPRVYHFQKVEFFRHVGPPLTGLRRRPAMRPEIDRTGWNQSHGDVQYLWGWDPKNQGDENGEIGTHVGFPFSTSLAGPAAILWVTKKEAFVECVAEVDGARLRTSAGLFGVGQWTVF